MPLLRSINVWHCGQVMALDSASFTVTGLPQLGQANWRPLPSLTDSAFSPLMFRSASTTPRPSVTAGGALP